MYITIYDNFDDISYLSTNTHSMFIDIYRQTSNHLMQLVEVTLHHQLANTIHRLHGPTSYMRYYIIYYIPYSYKCPSTTAVTIPSAKMKKLSNILRKCYRVPFNL
jgi:hypothetical protein